MPLSLAKLDCNSSERATRSRRSKIHCYRPTIRALGLGFLSLVSTWLRSIAHQPISKTLHILSNSSVFSLLQYSISVDMMRIVFLNIINIGTRV